jgi:radical SAM superfamily enzyme YgiQ (UPF0313 family)
MHYEGNIIRPPSEAYSILLQVTVGCSHNRCTFCSPYKGERFKIKPDQIIMEDIRYAAKHMADNQRLFICDGDALIVPQIRLISIMEEIRTHLPNINRVGVYANAKALKRKSVEELIELKKLGLGIIYMGLESGDDQTLKAVKKGSDSNEMITQGLKVKKAGIKLSITVLLGLAGPERSEIHAKETGRVLTAIDPEYVGALSLMLMEGTPMFDDYKAGTFLYPEPIDLLKELGIIINNTTLTNGRFHANHASNYLPIKAKFPEEKEEVLELIGKAIIGKVGLKPEWMRGF